MIPYEILKGIAIFALLCLGVSLKIDIREFRARMEVIQPRKVKPVKRDKKNVKKKAA